jgi:hypothetical protein
MSRQWQSDQIGVDLASGPDVAVETYWETCPACLGTKVIELLRESIPCTICTNGMVLVRAVPWVARNE